MVLRSWWWHEVEPNRGHLELRTPVMNLYLPSKIAQTAVENQKAGDGEWRIVSIGVIGGSLLSHMFWATLSNHMLPTHNKWDAC